MTEDSLQRATFIRTDEDGLLEFRVDDGRLISVEVTDELERGIIESKQILAELRGTPSPHSEKALPISTIQTLLRAGEDPQAVAEEYHLSEPLVRRFARPVDIEKHYQIDQFRHAHMPGSSMPHETVESALQAQLLQSGVRFTDVTWDATRHGHEPWRIKASFPQSGRTYTAEWAFDTPRGTITCLDQVSKRLFSAPTIPAALPESEDDDTRQDAQSRGVVASDERPVASSQQRRAAQDPRDDTDPRPVTLASGITVAQGVGIVSDEDLESTQRIPGEPAPVSLEPARATDIPAVMRQGRPVASDRRDGAATGADGAAAGTCETGAADDDAAGDGTAQSHQPKRPVFRKWDDIIFGE